MRKSRLIIALLAFLIILLVGYLLIPRSFSSVVVFSTENLIEVELRRAGEYPSVYILTEAEHLQTIAAELDDMRFRKCGVVQQMIMSMLPKRTGGTHYILFLVAEERQIRIDVFERYILVGNTIQRGYICPALLELVQSVDEDWKVPSMKWDWRTMGDITK